jgi:hypothetical protein
MKKKSAYQLRHQVASTRKNSVSAPARLPAREDFRSSLLTRRSFTRRPVGEGGFFNLRVLIGLFLVLAGLFLALVGFGTFSSVFAQNETTREQMAVELAQALAVQPPACVPGQEMFHDVPASNPFCPWIEELVRRGITTGCGGGNYCPSASVSRAQMAAFLLKTLDAAKSRFAVVNSNGTLVRGRGVVSTQQVSGFPAAYEIIFDTQTTGCAYIGTVGLPGIGQIDGFLTTARRTATSNGVFVRTFDASGVEAPRTFHVELLCP